MDKIKVLLVGFSSNLGGIEVFGRDLIQHSDPKKFQYTFLLGEKTVLPFSDEIEDYKPSIIRIKSRKRGYIRFLNDIRKVYQNNSFDIVHINIMSCSPFELVQYACKYSGASVVVHAHGAGFKTGHYKTRLLHKIGKSILRKHDYAKIACCHEAGKYLFGECPFRIIHNGIDFQKFKYSDKDRRDLRKEYGVGKSTIVLGNVAYFSPIKNHRFLIKTFASLKKRLQDSKLILVGTGPEMHNIQDLAEKLGIKKDVVFLGKRTDVGRVYSALDIYVMPSISEGLSISICEAQMNGLPCITSNGVSTESDISGNVTFLGLNNMDEWIDAIVSHLNDRKKVEKCPNDFNVDYSVKKVCNYYEYLVGRKNEK